MKQLTDKEKQVLQLIPRGSNSKVSIAFIGKTIGIDQRTVYEIIGSLRQKEIPICAKRSGRTKDRGYFIATTEQEREEGLAPYRAQVKNMLKLIYKMESSNIHSWEQTGGITDEN